MVRRIEYKGKVYKLTYDKYLVLDTVECEDNFITSNSAVGKFICRNADSIVSYKDIKNIKYL